MKGRTIWWARKLISCSVRTLGMWDSSLWWMPIWTYSYWTRSNRSRRISRWSFLRNSSLV